MVPLNKEEKFYCSDGVSMSLDKFKKKFMSYKRLLEADTLGSFDFFTCIICLDSVESSGYEAFKNALRSNNYSVLSKNTPISYS